MDELTPINDLLSKPDSLAPKSKDSTTTALSLPGPSELPQWAEFLAQIAQDKRHDLAPGILRLWKAKLESYRDEEISGALLLYSGEFFPSVDDIVAIMDRARERRWEEKQAQPEDPKGRIPATQADYDEMKRQARAIFAKMDKSNNLQLAERNKKAQEQARALRKSG